MSRIGKAVVTCVATVLLSACALTLCGCGSLPFFGGSGAATLTSSSVQMVKNAKNPLVNDSLMMTVTGIQRRPLSVFQGGSVKTATGPAQTSEVDSSSSDFVVVEVDMNIEFNLNTLASSSTQTNLKAETLEDLLLPGELMMITGTDQNGGEYTSCDILIPEGVDNSESGFSNSSWDYSLLKSQLPPSSQTKSGSILFKVSPTASDLKLVIVTAAGNDNPLDAAAVQNGNKTIYYLDI